MRKHLLCLGVLAAVAFASIGSALVSPPRALADGTFISAPDRRDIIYDDKRALLYISSGDRILRYDPFGDHMLSPWVIGGQLRAMDISPNGDTLAIADGWDYYSSDASPAPEPSVRVDFVDLSAGTTSSVLFPKAASSAEAGTWMVGYAADGRLLITSDGWSTNPLRRYDPVSGHTDDVADINGAASLGPAGDHSVVAFGEVDYGEGEWGVYHSADGSVTRSSEWVNRIMDNNYQVTASNDGTQIGFPMYGPLPVMLYYSNMNWLYEFGWSPAGLQYNRKLPELYEAMRGTSTMNVYDQASFLGHGNSVTDQSPEGTFDFESQFDWGQTIFQSVRIAASGDGTWLFATVPDGVRAVRMSPQVRGRVVSAVDAAPVAHANVELWQHTDAGWSIEATAATAADGSWRSYPETTSTVRVRVSDPTGAHAVGWYGGGNRDSALDVRPDRFAIPHADMTLALSNPCVVAGHVTSAETHAPVGGIAVSIWNDRVTPAVSHVATTSSDGGYAVSGLPPGDYTVRFDDSQFRFDTQYNAGVSTLASATVLSLSVPGTVTVDASLTPHELLPELAPAEVATGSSEFPVYGDGVVLTTALTDSALGVPWSGLPVVLQSSRDESRWTTTTASVASTSAGVYTARVSASASLPNYFRFALPASAHVASATSDDVFVYSHDGSAEFDDPVTDYNPASPPVYGDSTGAQTALYWSFGEPAPGQNVALMWSVDGSHFSTATASVTEDGDGGYRADFLVVSPLWYRFVRPATNRLPEAHSSSFKLTPSGADFGFTQFSFHDDRGRQGSGNTSSGGREYLSAGVLNGRGKLMANPLGVVLESSDDGQVWSDTLVQHDNLGYFKVYTAANYSKTYYRFSLIGEGMAREIVSQTCTVVPSFGLSLDAVSAARAGKATRVTGTVVPARALGQRVCVTIEKLVHGRWTQRRNFYAKPAAGSAPYMRFAVSVKLGAGTYHVGASLLADGLNSAAATPLRQFKVK